MFSNELAPPNEDYGELNKKETCFLLYENACRTPIKAVFTSQIRDTDSEHCSNFLFFSAKNCPKSARVGTL
jgi:hypothetical protein